MTFPLRYSIDRDDRLIAFSDTWDTFAVENDAAHLKGDGIRGRDLWQFIGDQTTAALYREILARVRAGGDPTRLTFRCDGPATRRLLRMDVAASHDGVVHFDVTAIQAAPRPFVARRRHGA